VELLELSRVIGEVHPSVQELLIIEKQNGCMLHVYSTNKFLPICHLSFVFESGRFMMALLAFEKVFVAAVNGPAVGIGVTLLMHCDLVYCTGNATFWVPFTRIALVPEFCSSMTFVEAMGMSNANELLLLGKKINAERAVLDRIVSGIVDVNITNSSAKDDSNAFASESIGSKVCQELDERLFQLCHGDKSAGIFVKMIRGRSKRRREFEILCREELSQLDKRLRNGEVLEAALNLNLSKNSKL